jgi:hypothetical protein
MEEEIVKQYLNQAEKLSNFVNNLDNKNYNNTELREFIKVISQSYTALLINLSSSLQKINIKALPG